MPTRCFIFDIDGTLSNCEHRLHLINGETKNWDAFFDACADDSPIQHMIDVARGLAAYDNIVYVSGRSDRARAATMAWMGTWGLPIGRIYMRKQGDYKPDHVLKLELLEQLRADGFEPIMVFDDRKTVVDMWRAAGIPCAQVAPGDF